jgi:tetratricopeptide (TPR) repeat protein
MIRLSIAVVLLLSATLPCGCGRGPRPRTRKARSGRVERPNAEAMRLNLRGCELRDLGEYDSAMYFFRAALELGRRNKLGMRMAAAYQNLGTVYTDRSAYSGEFDHAVDLDSAIACYDSASQIYSDSGKSTQMVSVITEKAVAYFAEPEYQERADSLFELARYEAERRGTSLDLGTILYHQAQLHARKAADARDLAGLRSAVALLDTAIIFIKKAGDRQFAGSAEMMAEDWRQAIVNIVVREE